MSEPINTGGDAFPSASCGDFREGMTLRDYFAAQCEVMAYRPLETFKAEHGRQPTVTELAKYIAEIRFIEADAMIAAREVKP